MRDAGAGGHLIEYILRQLELNHIKVEEAMAGSWPQSGLSPMEEWNLRITYELIRFMEEIPGGFFIYHADGDEEIIYANRGVLRLYRCDTMEEFRALTGNSFRGMVCAEELNEVEESIRRQIAENQYDLDYVEYRICRKDGTLHWVEDYGHFVRGETIGNVFYVFLSEAADEKNQQQMERKRLLAEALDKAMLAARAKSTFLSHISHELRTPLNAIFGFTALAKTCLNDPEEVKDCLEQVEQASQQLLDMITQTLEHSAMAGAAGLEETTCDLRGAVTEVCGHLQGQAEKKGISLQVDCRGITHSEVYTDEENLKRLTRNLVENGIHYGKPGGRVSVTLTEGEMLPNNYGRYCLTVQDDGPGMEPEFLERIFEPFSRGKDAALSGVHGMGLGLTISKYIVDMMGGSIGVESAPNQGSTFTVNVSFRRVPVAESVPAVSGRNMRILLVEDNEINLELETELLERQGFVIEPAENGKIALEKMEQAAPGDYDVILMDLQMPVMDGWQASAAIRNLPNAEVASIPIIALSANIMISDRRKSQESGIDVHLPKPMDVPQLLKTMEELLKKRTVR